MKKNVLITGASRGIGKSCALLFAENGYHVFLNCNKSLQQLTEVADAIHNIPGASCTLVPGDVGNPDAVRAIFQKIYAECDQLDILINNAGIAHIGLLHDMSDEEWMRILNANLSSVFYCCREAVPGMLKVHAGRILNVSSMWGTSGASCEAAYSATKSGIHGLTRALAKELAPSNIQVNAIAFGVIDTEMNGQLDANERAALADEIPAGRFATPGEAAQMIWDSVHAPEYMTGQVIGFDGAYL